MTATPQRQSQAGSKPCAEHMMQTLNRGKAWSFRQSFPDSLQLTATNVAVAYPQGNSSYQQKYVWPVYRVTGFGATSEGTDTFNFFAPLD